MNDLAAVTPSNVIPNLKPSADGCGEVAQRTTSPQPSALGFIQIRITTTPSALPPLFFTYRG
jgi:hypothetical protein